MTVLCRAFSKPAFSRQYVTRKEYARFAAEAAQNLPGFDGSGMRPSRFGGCRAASGGGWAPMLFRPVLPAMSVDVGNA